MATGLLGFNPYGKSQVIDVTSKPINMAIQMHQKEQAKDEALDKYFMEYDKNLSPAGMRTQDTNVLMDKMRQNKDFYFKYKEEIKHPEKYGSQYYNQYIMGNKEALGVIDQSKNLAANAKVFSNALMDAKKNNKTVPTEVKDALYQNELSIADPRHKAFDPMNFDAYDKHDAIKYSQSVYNKIKPDTETAEKVWNKGLGQYEARVTKDITNKALNQIETEVSSAYDKDRGLQDVVNTIKTDKAQVDKFAKIYSDFTGKKMPMTEKDLAVAYTLAMKPSAITSTEKYDNWKERADYAANIAAQKAGGGYSPESQIQAIYNSGDDKTLSHITVEGRKVEGRKVVLPDEVAKVYARKEGKYSTEPDYFYMSKDGKDVYPVFLSGGKTKSGADILDVKASERIPIETSLVPTMGKTYGGIGWANKNLYQNRPASSNTSQNYKHSATGANGEKIYSNDGVTWVNKNGKPIQ